MREARGRMKDRWSDEGRRREGTSRWRDKEGREGRRLEYLNISV